MECMVREYRDVGSPHVALPTYFLECWSLPFAMASGVGACDESPSPPETDSSLSVVASRLGLLGDSVIGVVRNFHAWHPKEVTLP